jgi:hypothetical protein
MNNAVDKSFLGKIPFTASTFDYPKKQIRNKKEPFF